MKKFGLIAMTMALLVTFAQCKKDNTTETPANNGKKVNISLTVDGGDGSKHGINYANGDIYFENGDLIYVVSEGTYLGTLSGQSSMLEGNYYLFIGDIYEPTEGKPLQFYFFGRGFNPTIDEVGKTFTVDISDQQTGKLPVIAYNHSQGNYTSGQTQYKSVLLNKCALVKFTADGAPTNLTIKGMNNRVNVSFADNTFTYDKADADGAINITKRDGYYWTILLPQATTTGTITTVVGDKTFDVPAISESQFLSEGIEIPTVRPVGAKGGLFTVYDDGQGDLRQVWFSQGNLQYIGSAGNGDANNTGAYWKFADEQWGIVGAGQFAAGMTIDRDLFGYGTSGYNNGQACYQPWSTERDGNCYNSSNILSGNADWGYNAISNGGNSENCGWRTLTSQEWDFVTIGRASRSINAYATAKVNGVNGLILLPDGWENVSPHELDEINTISAPSSSHNDISLSEWTTYESSGCVFLPFCGCRELGTSPYGFANGVGTIGYYWASNDYKYTRVEIGSVYSFTTNNSAISYLSDAYSVRLVYNAY